MTIGIGARCPDNAQFLFVTATLPEIITSQIKQEIRDVKLIQGPGLHRIPPTVKEVLVDCSVRPSLASNHQLLSKDGLFEAVFENKKLAMLNALTMQVDVERTLIFCNTIQQCRNVENVIVRSDRHTRSHKVLAYHSAIDAKVRYENLALFSQKLTSVPLVMICTDRASRGIDFNSLNVSGLLRYRSNVISVCVTG